MSGWDRGGWEARYEVRRLDGKPCDPRARYLVLNLGVDERGDPLDPNAHGAADAYAALVAKSNPQFAADLLHHLAHGVPVELGQHRDAK